MKRRNCKRLQIVYVHKTIFRCLVLLRCISNWSPSIRSSSWNLCSVSLVCSFAHFAEQIKKRLKNKLPVQVLCAIESFACTAHTHTHTLIRLKQTTQFFAGSINDKRNEKRKKKRKGEKKLRKGKILTKLFDVVAFAITFRQAYRPGRPRRCKFHSDDWNKRQVKQPTRN